jgi:hypothetical protein
MGDLILSHEFPLLLLFTHQVSLTLTNAVLFNKIKLPVFTLSALKIEGRVSVRGLKVQESESECGGTST